MEENFARLSMPPAALTLAEILLPLKLDKTFHYKIPADSIVKPGQIVQVDFHNRLYQGVVMAIHPEDTAETKYELKTINAVFPFTLPPALLQFIGWVAKYTLTPPGVVLKMVLSVKFNQRTLPGHSKKAQDELSGTAAAPREVTLSASQQAAADALINKLPQGFNVTVLDGVTGSGKTEVYLQTIAQVIANGGQALVLLPEIVLTTQLINRFTERFGIRPIEWHSNLSEKQRRSNWLNIISGKAQFVVGARSALFLPFVDLRVVVVDEEHDGSYKQEEGAIYNARDMAVVRAKLEKFLIILCSATPALETMHNIQTEKYDLLQLPSRYGEAVLPRIEAIDLRRYFPQKGKHISEPAQNAIIDTYHSGKQSMLFLNRRGYAPVTLCGKCHTKIGCPNCNAWLVEHRHNNKLCCHLCGYSAEKITACPNCGDDEKITSIGIGVEKLAEEVQDFLPAARIAILSSDTVLNIQAVEEVLAAIARQEIDIIIGTQMVAKGLHFPELHLVVVVDADAGYTAGDMRVLERTYQLLYQVAGRAGRMAQQGKVLLQTYEPQANIIKTMQQYDKQGFVENELHDRQLAHMPPFSRLVLITLSSLDEQQCLLYAKKIAMQAPMHAGVRILGPAPAPLFFVRKRYRWRILVKAERNIDIQALIQHWLAQVKLPASIRLAVDVDPYNFY